MFMYFYCFVCPVLCILFHCVVLCTVCVYMCTVLLPPCVNPIAVNKYIISYHIPYHITSYHIHQKWSAYRQVSTHSGTTAATRMLSVPAVAQFWRTNNCCDGDLIYRDVVTSTRHGVYEDTNKYVNSLPAYHMHFQSSRRKQTQRTHNGILVVSQQQR